LAIHELATNAAKYGALSTPEGTVKIDWRFEKGNSEKLIFVWSEVGGPPVEHPTRTGFGSRLITKVLASDFDGNVSIEYAPTGVRCVLEADASSVSRSNTDRKRG
jgi:two-component sensor histidine kinase